LLFEAGVVRLDRVPSSIGRARPSIRSSCRRPPRMAPAWLGCCSRAPGATACRASCRSGLPAGSRSSRRRTPSSPRCRCAPSRRTTSARRSP